MGETNTNYAVGIGQIQANLDRFYVVLDNIEDRVIAKTLQQWDKDIRFYIKSENMPQFFEVHFAYPNRPTAIVCTVQTVDGMAEVQIPNECLQQNKTQQNNNKH